MGIRSHGSSKAGDPGRGPARPGRSTTRSPGNSGSCICQKALSKRASERYSTAKDMADDLRCWLRDTGGMGSPLGPRAPVSTPPESTPEAAASSIISRQSDPDQRPIRIRPRRALRSFDDDDADFFLGLIPRASGPGWPSREHPVLEAEDRTDRPRPDVSSRIDLRTQRMWEKLPGQGGTAAPTGRACPLIPRQKRPPRRTEARLLKRASLRNLALDSPKDWGWSIRWRNCAGGAS